MSRGRQAKAEERNDFFRENLELVPFDTRIDVIDHPVFGYSFQAEGFFGEFRSTTVFSQSPATDLAYPKTYIETDDGRLTGFDVLGAEMVLSENGIGVLGSGETLGDNTNLPRDASAIDDNEGLSFAVLPPQIVIVGPGADPGGTNVNIGFTVLNNASGTVELQLFDGQTQTTTLVERDIENGQRGRDFNIGFEMPEDESYDNWTFSVDGNVEVAVTGIEYSINFDGLTSPI